MILLNGGDSENEIPNYYSTWELPFWVRKNVFVYPRSSLQQKKDTAIWERFASVQKPLLFIYYYLSIIIYIYLLLIIIYIYLLLFIMGRSDEAAMYTYCL